MSIMNLLKRINLCVMCLVMALAAAGPWAECVWAAEDVTSSDPVFAKSKSDELTHDESQFRVLKSHTIGDLKRMTAKDGSDIDLKELAKQKYYGYSVVQGSCTDGKYVYYLMVSSYTQKGIVLKVKLSNMKVVKRSEILDTHHGNGMTYDSRRNLLVVVAREARRQELTMIDADSLTIERQEDVKYDYYKKKAGTKKQVLSEKDIDAGLAAIAYNEKYDCYICLQRTYHSILIFDPDTLQATGVVGTRINARYPGTFQAMDADDQYVYLLLSYYSAYQPYNLILALDWNCENMLPVANGEKKYVSKAWNCNNDGSGEPDAAVRLGTKYEVESIYHTTSKKGVKHFYLTEYFNNPEYTYVTRTKTVRYKWKLVTKRVKWKKVKGKWKYKTRKYWKYKYKKVNYKARVVDHFNRDNYVYDIGKL